MYKKFKNRISTHFPYVKEGRLLIAISGGIDSVVLAHLCHKFKLDFALAHCNFNLRNEESNEDEDFVIKLGEILNAEVFVQNFDTEIYAKQNKCSIQMAARELRYEWFNDLATQLNFDYILTAHHADDNLETFLINLTRGTGLNGLTGIPEINDNVVRPLLQFSREEIENFAQQNNISWREDSSNSSRKYLRNKLRHEVVPILKQINPQLLDSFQNTLENLNDTADIVAESLNAVAKRAIVKINEDEVIFEVAEFKKVNNSKAYLFEMFKAYGFTEWNDIVDLLDAETGKYVISNTHKLIKHRDYLILTDVNENHTDETLSESIKIKDFQMISTPIGKFSFTEVKVVKCNTESSIYIDKEKLKMPLEIRKWRKGDIFCPSGMKGKKKLSKYLKDEKLIPSEKDKTLVLISQNQIVWVIGKRADERFKVEENTKTILKIELH